VRADDTGTGQAHPKVRPGCNAARRKSLRENSSTALAAIPWITTPDEGQAQFAKNIKAWKGFVRLSRIPQQD